MCVEEQHAWLHAPTQWHDAVLADGAHHHKALLLHHLHCVFKQFGSLTCHDFFWKHCKCGAVRMIKLYFVP